MIAQANSAPPQVTSLKTANYAASSGEMVQCDASGGSFTVTLPGSPRVNQIVGVKLLETTGGNAVTIARNGNAIEGEAGDATLSAASEYLELQYNGAGIWIDRTEQESSDNSAVATITASTTLTLDQEVVLCNNSSNITVTLPTASGISGKTYTLKKIGNNTATVTIDAAGSETIDGATTLLLYLRYDSIAIASDGSNWLIVADGLQPHGVGISRATAQSITSHTATKVLYGTVVFDPASLADIANSRIVIKRAGRYDIQAFATLIASGNIIELLNGAILVNGTVVRSIGEAQNANAYDLSIAPRQIANLSVGDIVESNVAFASTASPLNTNAGTSIPQLFVMELR